MVSSVVAVPITIILLVIGLAVLHRSALPSNAKMLWTILLIIFAPLALLPFAMRILPRLGSSPLGGQTESGRSA